MTQLVACHVSEGLISKDEFGSMGPIKTKPTELTVGCDYEILDSAESEDGTLDTTILTETPNLYKRSGDSVSDEGFVKLPRSLFNDPVWKGMREKYRKVFLTLLFHTSYTQKSYGIGTNRISIGPGQYCTSIRNLVDLCNDGVKYNEDKVDKNIVERSVSLFTKIGLVRQEVRHGKSVLTITQRELYEHFQNQTETGSETRPRLNRDTNEERKEGEDIKETNEGAKAPDFDSSLSNNESGKEFQSPSIFEAEKKVDLSQEKKKHFEILWKFVLEKKICSGKTIKPGIKESDIIGWLKKHEGKEIQECLEMALKTEIKKTWPGYITQVLKEKIPKRKADSIAGRRVVEDFVIEHGIKHIELHKEYFTDKISTEQCYYHLPNTTLNGILKRSLARSLEKDQARNEDQYLENY